MAEQEGKGKHPDTRGRHPNSRANLRHNKDSMHPNSLANLGTVAWLPGQSGNPAGSSLKKRMMTALDRPLTKPGPDASVADLLIYSTLEGALLREPTPLVQVWDRVEGKVAETHRVLGDIQIEVVFSDRSVRIVEGEVKAIGNNS